ncbi:MAG: hypothetical protein H7326_08240, partial [Bdellovibrionaceae bacterium]|nr:hypothetical protein [Pseudobdellovibrionaceae bacterium]
MIFHQVPQASATLNGQSIAATNPIVLSNLAEGDYELKVVALDSAGNQSNVLTHLFRIDFTKPVIAISAQVVKNPSNEDRNAFAFTASEESTYLCELDGAGLNACESPILFSGLAEGSHLFRAHAVDLAGNIGADVAYTWNIDTTAPITTVAATINGDSAKFVVSA